MKTQFIGMEQYTVETYWYLNVYIFYWQQLTILKQLLVIYTNTQPCHFDVQRPVLQTSTHNASNLQRYAARFQIVLVSAFHDFKWDNLGNMKPYKVIFWKGYKQAYQYLNKVRLTGWMYLWSSNTHIFLFVILSYNIMFDSRLTNLET